MFYDNEYYLKDLGFRKIKGFSRYMIKGSKIYNVIRIKRMTIRKDGRINLTKDNGQRTCMQIDAIKRLS